MNWLDLIIIVCLSVGLIKGLLDGFIKQVISFLALIAAILFSGHFAFPIKKFLAQFFTEDVISSQILLIIAYILSFIIIVIGINLVGTFISKVIKATPIKPLNILLGGFFGVALWIITLSIVINMISFFDNKSQVISKQVQENSVFYDKIKGVIPGIYPFMKNYFILPDKNTEKKDPSLIVDNFQLNNYVRRSE